MPAIQAMRSDALALRAKEDVQEKIPSFFNQVNKALGSNIISGQDNGQAVAEARFEAANALAASIRQKIDGEGSLAELVAGAGIDILNSSISLAVSVVTSKEITSQNVSKLITDILAFSSEKEKLQLQWDSAAATFAQWTVQAGFTNIPAGTFSPEGGNSDAVRALGGRGATMYRDALTPRWTDRDYYSGSSLGGTGAPTANTYQTYFSTSNVSNKFNNYETYYEWGSVGSISRSGRY